MEEDLFLEMMAKLGVKPVGEKDGSRRIEERGGEPQQNQVSEADLDEQERRLFLDAMAQMPNVTPKEETLVEDENLRFSLVKMKTKRAKKDLPTEQLDLHGMTKREAIPALRSFVTQAYLKKYPSVMVITGKGLHSQSGKAVLKQEVERWINHKGKRFIRAYAEAPRAYGGRGAFIIYPRKD